MLLTNLHPFTLISLFYIIAGQSQAQIQNKRTQQRSPFLNLFGTFLKTFIYLNTFVSLQTFAIPGSIFLSILSGYLFPFPLALFLVCLVSISAHVLVLTMSKYFYQLL